MSHCTALIERLDRRLLLCIDHTGALIAPVEVATSYPSAFVERQPNQPSIQSLWGTGIRKILVLQVRIGNEFLPEDMNGRNVAAASLTKTTMRQITHFDEGSNDFDYDFIVPNAIIPIPAGAGYSTSTAHLLARDAVAIAHANAQAQNPLDNTYLAANYFAVLARSSLGGGLAQVGPGNEQATTTLYSHVGNEYTGDSAAGLFLHELGHNLGVLHAASAMPGDLYTMIDDVSPVAPGVIGEYRDYFSVMGGSSSSRSNMSIVDKYRFGWLNQTSVPFVTTQSINQSHVYRIYAHDENQSLIPGKAYGAIVPMDQRRDFWIEFRRDPTHPYANDYSKSGVQLRWNRWADWTQSQPSQGGSSTALIDVNPLRLAGPESGYLTDKLDYASMDATLTVGQSFSDPGSGLSITTLSVNYDSAAQRYYCEIAIEFERSEDAPTLDLIAETNFISAAKFAAGGLNRRVNFKAIAQDDDADPRNLGLRYMWEVSALDGGWTRLVTPPSTLWDYTHTFNAVGVYRVRGTVTDASGHSVSDTVLVRVGEDTPPLLVNGRVVDSSGSGIGGATVALYRPDSNPSPTHTNELLYDTAITDEDGFYTIFRPLSNGQPIPNLQLVAVKAAYHLNVIADSALDVANAQRTRVDFVGTAIDRVTISGVIRNDLTGRVSGATVHAGSYSARTDPNGNYRIRVPRGRYLMSASSADGRLLVSDGVSTYTEADAAVESPPAYNFRTLDTSQRTVRVNLQGFVQADSEVILIDSVGRQHSNRNGGILDPLNSFIDVRLPTNGATHLWPRFGTRWTLLDATSIPISLVPATTSGSPPQPLTFIKQPSSGNISGAIAGDEKITGAIVRLYSGATLLRETTSDSFGTYCFPAVATGTYSVQVTHPTSTFAISSKSVTVANGTESVASFDANHSYGTPSFSGTGIFVGNTSIRQAVQLSSAASGDPSVRYEWSGSSGVSFAPDASGNAVALFPGAGTYSVTVVATDRFGRLATRTQGMRVGTITDQVPPMLRSISFAFEREQALYLQFSEPIAPIDIGKTLVLTRSTSTTAPTPVDWAAFITSMDPISHTLQIKKVTGGQNFVNGRYALFVSNEAFNDTADQSGVGVTLFDFSILAGDATMNESCAFDDLVALSQHYDLPGTWSDGDFNYDGVVDFQDMIILAQNYNTSI